MAIKTETDVPPSRLFDIPPSSQCEIPPSSQCKIPPSSQFEIPPSSQCEIPLSPQREIPPSPQREMSPSPSPQREMSPSPSSQREMSPSPSPSPSPQREMSPSPSPSPSPRRLMPPPPLPQIKIRSPSPQIKRSSSPEANFPPLSQSHFAKFETFTPDDDAPFEAEFARLAASQEWAPGSHEFDRERTIAMRAEIKHHYFKPSQEAEDGSLTFSADEELQGYQALCAEIGIPWGETVDDCKKELSKPLVNIVDLIDARRTASKVKVWQDFGAFCRYTLEDGHIVNSVEAKKDGGYLATLLRHVRGGRRQRRRRGKAKNLGRVTKSSQK